MIALRGSGKINFIGTLFDKQLLDTPRALDTHAQITKLGNRAWLRRLNGKALRGNLRWCSIRIEITTGQPKQRGNNKNNPDGVLFHVNSDLFAVGLLCF